MRPRRLRSAALAILGGAAVAPVWAVSLSAADTAQSLTDVRSGTAAESVITGSAALVPLMASEMQANQISTVETTARNAGGAPVEVGKPMNDIAFVRVATEAGRREVSSARDALPQLKAPELKRIAEMVVTDHTTADARLNMIAAAKQWPVPGPAAPAEQAADVASSDFDARWIAEMIDAHERAVALYRAQAAGGADKDLRKYARDTLPTIEQHLAQLESLQK